MLTKVSAYSHWSFAPVLNLSESGIQGDRIQIQEIEGLGPVGATVNTTPYGSIDGESYSGSSVPSRNITLTVGLNPDWDVWSMEALRRLLYRYFMPKQPVRLVFDSDDEFPSVYIDGYTETVEPSLFAKDQEIQISIVCPDPYFYAVEPVVITGDTPGDPVLVDYIGSVEAGINLTIEHEADPAPGFSLVLTVQIGDPTENFFGVAVEVHPTQYFMMGSIPGKKYVQTVDTTTGAITNRLPLVVSGSAWPTLKPGANSVLISSNSGEQSWELIYVPKFGGL